MVMVRTKVVVFMSNRCMPCRRVTVARSNQRSRSIGYGFRREMANMQLLYVYIYCMYVLVSCRGLSVRMGVYGCVCRCLYEISLCLYGWPITCVCMYVCMCVCVCVCVQSVTTVRATARCGSIGSNKTAVHYRPVVRDCPPWVPERRDP